MKAKGFAVDEGCALELDARDPLARFREGFHVPAGAIYMDGNSLGLLSREAEARAKAAIDAWRSRAVGGWFSGDEPWLGMASRLGAMAAPLVGAEADEVVATGTTTVNIHAMVSTFFEPDGRRRKILADELDFPSDLYALAGQIEMRGLDPAEHLVLVPSRDGRTIDEDLVVEMMTDDVALALLPSVLYRSAQLLDMPRLAREARTRGIVLGFDCCHSAGAIPHRFDEWGVDFAVWCSYKYLNAGPGSTAFLYVNRRHFDRRPRLAGWFGFERERQFEMLGEFEHDRSAMGWQISSPAILSAAPAEGALSVVLEAGIDAIRAKSTAMTEYLVFLIDELLSADPYLFEVASPRDPARRGGHVAISRGEGAREICRALEQRGVVPDFREPDVIRIAPIALYNTFHEVWRVARHLVEIVDSGEWRR